MYREINGFEKYRVGRDGSVWSRRRKRWKRLRPVRNANGYQRVTLYRKRDGRTERVQEYLHRLVLLTFVGPCPAGLMCRHLDGNPANNRADNLAWGTSAENSADALRHGTHLRGEDAPTAKLEAWQSLEVLWLFEHVTQNRAEIARRVGIARTSVVRILSGETWAHVLAA